MNENNPNIAEETTFEEMLDASFAEVKNGKTVKGTVLRVTSNEITVDLGYKSDGIISRGEFTDDTTTPLAELVKPGDEFDVFIVRVNDGDGNVVCSKRKLDSQAGYRILEEAFENKTPVPGKITDVVRGGLTANIHGCRAFVPSSQISGRFVEDLTPFKGREFNFHILELDRRKRRIVAGRKELAVQEADLRRNELFSTLEVGQKLTGTVSRLVDFGAFIDLGGVDGLIHVSELSWKRVKKAADVLKIGDEVTVAVVGFDPEKGKISLTLRDPEANPWKDIETRFPVDSIVEGTVVRFAPFGAFVKLVDGVDGLIHISQIAHKHITKADEVLTIGETVQVLVTAIDLENQKISLSKKLADEELGLYTPEYDDEEEYEEDDADYDEEEAVEEEPAVEEEAEEEPPVKKK